MPLGPPLDAVGVTLRCRCGPLAFGCEHAGFQNCARARVTGVPASLIRHRSSASMRELADPMMPVANDAAVPTFAEHNSNPLATVDRVLAQVVVAPRHSR